MAKKEKIEKFRNFAFILYDDSCVQDWKRKLNDTHVKGFWIYHDKDKTEKGELKKPHYHVLIMWRNNTTKKVAKSFGDKFGASNGKVVQVMNLEGYARYLCHKDKIDEGEPPLNEVEDVEEYDGNYEYPDEAIHALGGADYKKIIQGAEERQEEKKRFKMEALKGIIGLCNEKGLNNYCAVVDYCLENNDDWTELLLDIRFGRLIQDYIKCKYWLGY